MIPRSQRISRRLFGQLGRSDRTQSSLFIVLKRFPLPRGVSGTHISIAVSKKDAKTALVRNNIRRRYAHLLKNLLRGMPDNHAYHILVKKPGVAASFQEMEEDLRKTISRIAS